jgi:acyl dehydratase
MPEIRFDAGKLLAYRVPEIREGWTLDDTAFYALSLGLGSAALDRDRLRYLRAAPDMAVLPSMTTVIAHPGFWLADPESGVDPGCALHGEQAIIVHAPLPPGGEFVSRTELTELIDKGEGRDAILVTETTLLDAGTDTLLTTLVRKTVLRGCGGFGGQNASPTHSTQNAQPGDPKAFSLETRPEQALIYALNGDDNPLHTDPDFAMERGFPKPLLHGLCTLGIATYAVVEMACGNDPASLREISMRFSGPVYPGETIDVRLDANGSFEAWVAQRNARVVSNGTFASRR